jgi:microcystin-dependent protein
LYGAPQNSGAAVNFYDAAQASTLNGGVVGAAGGSQPHNNMQPYLSVTFYIALQGIFPSRN